MNEALDLVDAIFEKPQHDGRVLLDPSLDIFKPIADSQPLFRAYREFTRSHDAVLSPNGKTRHLHYKLALDEVLNPQDESNIKTREKTIEYLQVQSEAGIFKLHDSKLALADKLTSQDGANSIGKQAVAHAGLSIVQYIP